MGCGSRPMKYLEVILLMEEILHHLGCRKPDVNNGISTTNNLNWLAFSGFLNHQPYHSYHRKSIGFESSASKKAHLNLLVIISFHWPSRFIRGIQGNQPQNRSLDPDTKSSPKIRSFLEGLCYSGGFSEFELTWIIRDFICTEILHPINHGKSRKKTYPRAPIARHFVTGFGRSKAFPRSYEKERHKPYLQNKKKKNHLQFNLPLIFVFTF